MALGYGWVALDWAGFGLGLGLGLGDGIFGNDSSFVGLLEGSGRLLLGFTSGTVCSFMLSQEILYLLLYSE